MLEYKTKWLRIVSDVGIVCWCLWLVNYTVAVLQHSLLARGCNNHSLGLVEEALINE